MFVCHDYPPSGRQAPWQTTVADQRAYNIHVRDGIAGRLPPAEADGVSYLKIPIHALGKPFVDGPAPS